MFINHLAADNTQDTSCAKRIVAHQLFEPICALAIVANSVVLALASDTILPQGSGFQAH